ncbi:MAG: hypothetical protein M4D80_33595 [Myxococcota bacterium]|nr:hypothetical protein [Myxococcota bacterium]
MKRIICLLALTACDATPELARLDHSQILAVRTEPATVAPGERARIDILAGDDSGAVFEAAPDRVVARSRTTGPLLVERTADGWFVTAGGPEIATIEVALEIDGTEWRATKSLVVNATTENPRITTMQIDGADTEALVAAAGTKPSLTVVAEGELEYAWYSSVGDLELYRQPSAVLDAAEPAEGHVVIVVRDTAGGVTWKLLPARVE